MENVHGAARPGVGPAAPAAYDDRMPLAIQAKNFRGLVEVDWTIPPGLSVVVGANGAGKTTLLFAMDVLRQTACGD